MRYEASLMTIAGLCAASPAEAEAIRPFAEARLRYEHVDQEEVPGEADAVTLRVRTGVEASEGPLAALVEAQGTIAIVPSYFDGLRPRPGVAQVSDPQNVALYRAQLRYRTANLTITAGRQKLAIDDERFVGAANFRQNGQTFDAVRIEATPLAGVRADVTYAWSVRTIWGIDGAGARPTAVGGNNVFATLGTATPIGTVEAFAYLVDHDEVALSGYRLSSQSYGARLTGSRKIGRGTVAWSASHAVQRDYARNPNRYHADYWLADVALDLAGPTLGAGYEVLGADDGRALTSFQTPLSSLFKFQGWADKLTTTPSDGTRDLYASAGWAWKTLGRATAVSLQAVYHRFTSDRDVRRYGDELDVLASARLGRAVWSIRYADYRARTFATDTRKLWVQLDWGL